MKHFLLIIALFISNIICQGVNDKKDTILQKRDGYIISASLKGELKGYISYFFVDSLPDKLNLETFLEDSNLTVLNCHDYFLDFNNVEYYERRMEIFDSMKLIKEYKREDEVKVSICRGSIIGTKDRYKISYLNRKFSTSISLPIFNYFSIDDREVNLITPTIIF